MKSKRASGKPISARKVWLSIILTILLSLLPVPIIFNATIIIITILVFILLFINVIISIINTLVVVMR